MTTTSAKRGIGATPLYGAAGSGLTVDLFTMLAGYRVGQEPATEEVRHLHLLIDLRQPPEGDLLQSLLAESALHVLEFSGVGLTPERALLWLKHLWSDTEPSQVHIVLVLPEFSMVTGMHAGRRSRPSAAQCPMPSSAGRKLPSTCLRRE